MWRRLRFEHEARSAIQRILSGARTDAVESETLDCKEDPSTRAPDGTRSPGAERSDDAARLLTDAACCLANADGGSLLVGFDDTQSGPGAARGTRLDAAWLQTRVRELSSPPLAVSVTEEDAAGARVLMVGVPRNDSTEPHAATVSRRGGQRRARRVGRECQEMLTVAEMLSWARERSGYDWSAQPSGLGTDSIRPAAIGVIREFLRESGEPDRVALAGLEDRDLVRQLQLVRRDDRLTSAGALLLVGEADARLVYARRPIMGARSTTRVTLGGRSLIEELRAVLEAIATANPASSVAGAGIAEGRVEALPPGAIREVLVNAIMHRDWERAATVTIDHAGGELVVHSPGGFVDGISPDTVLTAPARTRNPHLGNVLRSIRVAEREGTGVDRMYVEMVQLGHRPPTFSQRDGGVRVTLAGGEPIAAVLQVHARLPERIRRSARTAVAIDLLRSQPSISARELAVAAQEGETELETFLAEAVAGGLLQPTAFPRRGGELAWRLADAHRDRLGSVLPYFARPAEESVRLITRLAETRGEVRNQDVQDLLGLTSARASQLLKRAEADGAIVLGPGAKPTGRGTYYVPRAERRR